jgi:carbamoyl-phosphate synthase large subunit
MTFALLSGRRIVVTGVGSPRGVATIRALERLGAELFAADVSFHAAGLYLVPRERRIVLSPPDCPEYVPELLRECRRRCVELVVPTETEGLLGLAAAKPLFESHGVSILVPGIEAASLCLDRLKFHHHVRSMFPTPKLFSVSSPEELLRLPRPFELEGRDPESGITREFLLDLPEYLRNVRWIRAVARRVLPGPELRVSVLGAARGEVAACLAVEHFMGYGGHEPGACRVVRDHEIEALAASVFEHLGLEGLVTVRVVRNALGKPEVVSIDPVPDTSVRLAAMAGRDLLGVAVAGVLGVDYALPSDPPEEIASVRMTDEIFISANLAFDTAELTDWSTEVIAAPEVVG